MNFARIGADSDDSLMLRVQHRDEAAFEMLVHRYTRVIHAFLFRLTGDRVEAEDLTQETFLRMWQRSSKWEEGTVKFTTWLHQIARNLCIDEFRKAQSKKRTIADANEEVQHSPLDRVAEQDQAQTIRNVLGKLPERQRTALVLCQVQGWSQQEAAQVVGTTTDGIQALIARARRTLRDSVLIR